MHWVGLANMAGRLQVPQVDFCVTAAGPLRHGSWQLRTGRVIQMATHGDPGVGKEEGEAREGEDWELGPEHVLADLAPRAAILG